MKRRLTYLVLEATLWIGISLLVSSGWAETEPNVISFVSTTDEDRPIILMNTQGEVLQKLITEPGQLSASTWSPDRRSIVYEACRNGNCEIHLIKVRTNVRRNAHRQLTFDGGHNRSLS